MHVTVVAKAPVPGRVKTRLCPPCTPHQAADIATAAIADTLDAIDATLDVTTRRVLLLDGDAQPWMPAHWKVIPQRGHGLGERLRNGFADLGPGIITGMETPHVAGLLADALRSVAHGIDVIGLADDGGYWTIGLSSRTIVRLDKVFDGVPMSTSSTGELQVARLRALGAIHLLPTARDLDTIDDLRAVATSHRAGRLPELARSIVRSDRLAPG